ncbi:hypothetical protein PoB_001971200 [Plakobranchus ocellatus]|uniref:Uncharacterized protein n=1 Tax=Plakobranchus ocellatus TaxID=259542 RepID=A0AAV3ZFE3_9GAST|nr:hypothetical protein PoB_001971200 [Plakobranchus ocellatus]
MPLFFKETAMLQDNVSGIRTHEPQRTRQTTFATLLGLLLSSSPSLTPVSSKVKSRPSPDIGHNLSLVIDHSAHSVAEW